MGLRAVIADDEIILRVFLSMTLTGFGIEIQSEAQDGSEVVNAVRTHKPDVAFLDINMASKEDGLDACEIIKAENPDTKVIFISAYPEKMFTGRLSSMSYDGFLEKPVNKTNLKNYLCSKFPGQF